MVGGMGFGSRADTRFSPEREVRGAKEAVMPDPNLESTVFPRGRDGLMGPGPVAPGPGQVPHQVRDTSEEDAAAAGQNLEKLTQALTPQLAAEVAAKTARLEARGAAREVLEEERKAAAEEALRKKDRLRPFFGFMESLRNLAASGPGGEGPEGRTELVLKLYRLVETGGPKPQRVFQTQVQLSQDEALGMADPDFEGRTMEWAMQQGQFGRFEWRMLGWADGESILDTSYTVTVEAPAGYQPPARPAVPTEPEAKPDPMGQLKETLGLVTIMREAFGMKTQGGGLDAGQMEVIRSAAAANARLEASEAHRRELRDLEDRHRRELEAAEEKGYRRGQEEGKREMEAEKLRWELSRAKEAPEGPSFLQEVTGMLGGPDAVQGLVGGLVAAMNRPPSPKPSVSNPSPRQLGPVAPKAPVRPLRPAMPDQGPAAPFPTPASNPSHGAEPNRGEWKEAMEQVEEALDGLEELLKGSEADPGLVGKATQLQAALERFRGQGLVEGSLAAWWAQWPQVKPYVDEVLEAGDEPEEEPVSMDLEGLRALLMERLEEGEDDDTILREINRHVPKESMNKWRQTIKLMPKKLILDIIGIKDHDKRLNVLIDKIF